jgi:aryl-alcohol dehydrogenase-like predicted oxidoreductase
VKSRWHLGAMILGATSLAQLEEDVAAAQFDLDASMLEALGALQIRYPNPAG